MISPSVFPSVRPHWSRLAFELNRRCAAWQVPVLLLVALLQRTPVLRALVSAEVVWVSGSAGQMLRAVSLTAVALGAVDTLAGATILSTNPAGSATATVGTSFSAAFAVTGAPKPTLSYSIVSLPPGLTVPGSFATGGELVINSSSGTITGTPTTAGVYDVGITAWEFMNADGQSRIYTYRITVNGPPAPPTIATQPTSRKVALSGLTTFSVVAGGTGPFSYQWRKNGVALPGATSSSLTISSVQSSHVGVYSAAVTNAAGTTVSNNAILGVEITAKVVGTAFEHTANITHPNGKVYDQILLTGTASTITADPGQVVRASYIDLSDDIVQIEFAGNGSLSITFESLPAPAPPVNYNQSVDYVRGHATLTIVGADESTNVSVFSVGRLTAFDPTGTFDFTKPASETNNPALTGSPLFKSGTNYDGIADIALINILSNNGQFGGVRCANAQFFAAAGLTGVNLPSVNVVGPVNLYDIAANDNATPVILTGTVGAVTVAGGGVGITGGDMLQNNNSAVRVGDVQKIAMLAGVNSHNGALPAQTNRAVYTRNGVDVTSQLVINPQ